MKTVICIDEGTGHPQLGHPVKGSEYILTKVIQHTTYYYKGKSSNIWYELLETGIAIHSSLLFSEPIDVEDTIEIEAEILN